MRISSFILTSCWLFSLAGTAAAEVFVSKPEEAIWVRTNENTQVPIGPVPVGNTSSSWSPLWGVSQWNSPVPFSFPYNSVSSEYFQNGTNWSLSNSAGAIAFDKTSQPWLNGVYRISQSGEASGANPGLACGTEYDLWLEPHGMPESPPLSQVNGIWFNLGVNILYQKQGAKCVEGFNAAAATLGIIFRNKIDNTNIFYQLIFNDSRGGVYDSSAWSDGFGHIGVNDSISIVSPSSMAPLPGRGRSAFSLNLFDRITKFIRAGRVYVTGGERVFDSELSHYVISGVYFGNHIWGDSVLTTEWDNFSLIY